jgi:predicted dehydrogenase
MTMMFSRRAFLQTAAVSGALAAGGCRSLLGRGGAARRGVAGERLNVAVIGAAGRGEVDWRAVCASGNRLAALCDVDEGALLAARETAAQMSPAVRLYKDFRVMLETERGIDVVVVATPDHGHALQAAWAMEKGCHVYVEPPLARTLGETAFLLKKARACGVALRLGDQGSALPEFRRAAGLLSSGIIGAVSEVHAWTPRPVWPQGGVRPEGSDPAPDALDWDLWLCGAPVRPFKDRVYHRYNWRGWCDFGTGALGDVGCHLLNLPLRALGLEPPASVSADGDTERQPEMFPKASRVWFAFDAPSRRQPPVALEWCDGGNRPDVTRLPAAVQAAKALPESGCLLVGEGGVWLMADEFGARHCLALAGEPALVDAEKHKACARAAPLPRGPELLRTFLDEVRERGRAASDPEQVKAVMETVLTGCIAQRVPGRLFWKSRKGRFDDSDAANRLVATEYREGWSCQA